MKSIQLAILFIVLSVAFPDAYARADENPKCKSLDTREFGLVSDGEIVESWSEAKLLEKYGPPCIIIELGEVYFERVRGRITEIDPKTIEKEKWKSGATTLKKQYIYSGDSSNRTSVFTILDGVVVKKERLD